MARGELLCAFKLWLDILSGGGAGDSRGTLPMPSSDMSQPKHQADNADRRPLAGAVWWPMPPSVARRRFAEGGKFTKAITGFGYLFNTRTRMPGGSLVRLAAEEVDVDYLYAVALGEAVKNRMAADHVAMQSSALSSIRITVTVHLMADGELLCPFKLWLDILSGGGVAHALVGCVSAEASGGRCGPSAPRRGRHRRPLHQWPRHRSQLVANAAIG
jgi:hypothetical protein